MDTKYIKTSMFSYEPETGVLRWAVKRGKVKPGDEAGCLAKTCGYRMVRLDGVLTPVHRIIWDMLNPTDKLQEGDEIDHIDHDKLNNRASNLRKVCHLSNMHNRSKHKNNTSGVTGVAWAGKQNKWYAYIYKKGTNYNLGYFSKFEDAVFARKEAEIKLNFHKNHGE
ncbi:HNH endonuclease [Salmonella enterica]